MRAYLWVMAALVVCGPALAGSQPQPAIPQLAGNPTGARAALGLGGAATLNTGTTIGTVAAGDDSRLSIVRTGAISTQAGLSMQPYFLGNNAGTSYPINSTGDFGTLAVGSNAMPNLTNIGSENVAVGAQSCYALVTGTLTTCIGMHSLGSETGGAGNTAIGNDAMRDSMGSSYVTAMGQHAAAHGTAGLGTVAIGSQTLRGNSGAVLLSGTITAGDVVTVNLSSAVSGVTGLPFSTTHTVTGGDTLFSIANDLAAKLNASGVAQTGFYPLATITYSYLTGEAVISFQFSGTTTLGWAISITASTSGAGTEITTVLPGSNPTQTTVVGSNAVQGEGLQNPTNLSVFGQFAGQSIRLSNYTSLFGGFSGSKLTTGSQNSFYGALSGQNVTTGNYNDIFGFGAGGGLTTGSNNLILGQGNGPTCVTSSAIVLIGANKSVDCPASNTSSYINVQNSLIASTQKPVVVGGFGTGAATVTGASSAAFTINVGTSPGSSGTVAYQTAAPNGYMCQAVNATNYATSVPVVVVGNTSRNIIYNYSRTTNILTAFSSNDILNVTCSGY